MLGRLALQFWTDARHFQIVALGALLAVNFAWLDFGARPLASALALVNALNRLKARKFTPLKPTMDVP